MKFCRRGRGGDIIFYFGIGIGTTVDELLACLCLRGVYASVYAVHFVVALPRDLSWLGCQSLSKTAMECNNTRLLNAHLL